MCDHEKGNDDLLVADVSISIESDFGAMKSQILRPRRK